MISIKKKLTKIIEEQPDDSTSEEILKELAFSVMIERGLSDSDARKTIENDEMLRRIKLWQK